MKVYVDEISFCLQVLRNVFSYLNLRDLKTCREINSFWDKLTVPYLKKICGHISFNNDNYWTNIRNHDIHQMAKFVECCDASTNFPFSKLDIGTSVISEPSHEVILTNFFRLVSPWVTEITIRDEWGQNLFSQGLPEKFPFPSLEVLTIHFIQTVNREEDLFLNFDFMTNIMEKATSLEKLMLIDHNGLDGKVVTHFVKSIEKANCKKISKLDIAAQIEDDHLIQMSTMGLQLKVLILDFWGSMIDQTSLKMFLESQSETLLDLKIADYAMSSNFSVEFPRMRKLKRLMVQGSMLGRICVTFPNISYINQFPVLKRLSFSNALNEWDDFLKFGIQPVATVSELKLPGDFSDEDSLLHAARLFPNIKKLEVPAFLRNTNVVYDAMPNLEELILITKHVGEADDIITGLTLAECEEIKHFSKTMFRTLEEEFDSILTTKPLSCLKSNFNIELILLHNHHSFTLCS